jgi:hypothetical protein
VKIRLGSLYGVGDSPIKSSSAQADVPPMSAFELANSVRKRAGDEESAVVRAKWEILAGTYVRLADQSAKSSQPKKIDDTGAYWRT